jgi:hypothetical protein
MFWSVRGSAAPAPVPVVVGGRKSLASISMVLDDSYVKHPSHARRRMGLHVRDARGDPVAAAHAGNQ